MLTVLLYILVMVLLVLLVLVIFAAARPNDFTIRRSIVIKAAPQQVFALIEDFRQWHRWSPWERLDPSMNKTLSGAASGTGSIYEWDGNRKAGAGRMEIVSSTRYSAVDIQLIFRRPFQAQNRTLFTLAPQKDGTYVTWEMSGTNSLIPKIMGMVMNIDKLVGRNFERGLVALRTEAEHLPAD